MPFRVWSGPAGLGCTAPEQRARLSFRVWGGPLRFRVHGPIKTLAEKPDLGETEMPNQALACYGEALACLKGAEEAIKRSPVLGAT